MLRALHCNCGPTQLSRSNTVYRIKIGEIRTVLSFFLCSVGKHFFLLTYVFCLYSRCGRRAAPGQSCRETCQNTGLGCNWNAVAVRTSQQMCCCTSVNKKKIRIKQLIREHNCNIQLFFPVTKKVKLAVTRWYFSVEHTLVTMPSVTNSTVGGIPTLCKHTSQKLQWYIFF